MRNSKIILSKNINIDRQYTNVLNYSEQQMLELCQQNLVAQAENYSFIRSQNKLQVGFTFEQCLQANYIAFQNPSYSNKWFFAWIDDVAYKGDLNTEITYTIDAWSTWFSNWKPKTCFVSREHVNDDTVGLHTIEENLNVGQMICDWIDNPNIIGAESYYWFVVASNYDPSNETRYAGLGSYGKYPQGNMWFAWLVNINNQAETFNEISGWIYEITKDGKDSFIQTMFALPYQAFSLSDVDATSHLVTNGGGKQLNEDLTFTKSIVRGFTDFTPKNNKLFVYPYSFLRITNNLGSFNDFKIEDFHEVDAEGNETDELTFNAIGVPCQGYSGKIRPKNYQGLIYNEDESVALGKYPTLSWSSDGFTNWLTQNAVNLGINAINTAIVGATQLTTGDIAGGIGTVSKSIGNTIGSMYSASMIPNMSQGNANAGDISFSQNLTRFKILHIRPKKEYLQIIDDYFTRFGYKVNILKVPNITGRKYWNYVEIGSSEEIGYGDVPAKYMDIINNACRRGVTIWHSHDNIGNYSLDNSIV